MALFRQRRRAAAVAVCMLLAVCPALGLDWVKDWIPGYGADSAGGDPEAVSPVETVPREFMSEEELRMKQDEFRHVYKYTELGVTILVVAFDDVKIQDTNVQLLGMVAPPSEPWRKDGRPETRVQVQVTSKGHGEPGIGQPEAVAACSDDPRRNARFELQFTRLQYWVHPRFLGKLSKFAGKILNLIPEQPRDAGVLVEAQAYLDGFLVEGGGLELLTNQLCMTLAPSKDSPVDNPVRSLITLASYAMEPIRGVRWVDLGAKLEEQAPLLKGARVDSVGGAGGAPPGLKLTSGLSVPGGSLPDVIRRALEGALIDVSLVGDSDYTLRNGRHGTLTFSPYVDARLDVGRAVSILLHHLDPTAGTSLREYGKRMIEQCAQNKGGCGTVNTVLYAGILSALFNPDSAIRFEGTDLSAEWAPPWDRTDGDRSISASVAFGRARLDWADVDIALPTDWALIETYNRAQAKTNPMTPARALRGDRNDDFIYVAGVTKALLTSENPPQKLLPSRMAARSANLDIGPFWVEYTFADDKDQLNRMVLAYIACGGYSRECLETFESVTDYLTLHVTAALYGAASMDKDRSTITIEGGLVGANLEPSFLLWFAGLRPAVPGSARITPGLVRETLGYSSF